MFDSDGEELTDNSLAEVRNVKCKMLALGSVAKFVHQIFVAIEVIRSNHSTYVSQSLEVVFSCKL
jgi:hypothetical protein